MFGIFNIFRKKELPTKTLVGKVKAFYRFDRERCKAEFCYNLFVDSNNKRSYGIEVVSNNQLLHRSFVLNWSNNMGYHEMIAKQHKYWNTVINPWLSGEDLCPKFHVDASVCVQYISKGLKADLVHALNDLELAIDNKIYTEPKEAVDAIRALINKATEA